MLLGPFGGAIADRYRRRTVLLANAWPSVPLSQKARWSGGRLAMRLSSAGSSSASSARFPGSTASASQDRLSARPHRAGRPAAGPVLCRRDRLVELKPDRPLIGTTWGGWLLVTGLVFSYMSGIIHPYYTIALAPAIGALVGIGSVELWRVRHTWFACAVLAAGLVITAIWAWVLFDRSPGWFPWLRVVIITAGVAAAGMILARRALRPAAAGAGPSWRQPRCHSP